METEGAYPGCCTFSGGFAPAVGTVADRPDEQRDGGGMALQAGFWSLAAGTGAGCLQWPASSSPCTERGILALVGEGDVNPGAPGYELAVSPQVRGKAYGLKDPMLRTEGLPAGRSWKSGGVLGCSELPGGMLARREETAVQPMASLVLLCAVRWWRMRFAAGKMAAPV